MTVMEAARRLECKPSTVYALCAAGRLGHRRVGVGRGVIRIDEADLVAYLTASRVPPGDREAARPAPQARGGTDWVREMEAMLRRPR